ncbi:mucin-17-like isoform X2 [Tribolium madens]|uniref:mucin-17-like isoform X2 n=1 Tax=Tribolium madens TaxID=41895 RepID=UPI001CF7453C|nr:mucin-17-like isoform X2 [Tribolium madens]
MAKGTFLIFVCVTTVATFAFPHPGEDIITQPKPGEEYVFVQTTGSGARPIARKDKQTSKERPFETAHKLPPSLTYILNQNDDDVKIQTKSKREANPAESPAPAPAGAIKLDVQKLLEKYKTELKTSTTEAPRTTTKTTRRRGNKRTKKEIKEEVEVTSPSPVLTTGVSAPKKVDDDIPLVASGSEKQRSRIQIKKAPNGQEYEYEYVYYYYDDDEDPKVTNAHDGPAKTSNKSRGTVERTSAAPEANEVVPSSRGKTRGRQLGEEEVSEERLPANTRFPPRSRNLNTTPLPEEETKATRGRGRGRPTTEAAPSTDSVSDETQGSRGRTRANVRRPSLELVDNASFNTHPGSEPSGNSPSFPTDLPAGPVPIASSDNPPEPKKEETSTEIVEETGTTAMSAMDKVALDLYAILQGTQKLSGEDADLSSEENATDSEATTLEPTTEQIIETTTPTTTTTTTTTTTPAPTTTTTTEAPIGRGRFKGRGRKTTHAASTTEAAHTETKPKSKFSRPSFGGRHRAGARSTTEAAVEPDASKEESKPVSHSRPTLSRSRFGATRSRTRTTAAPSDSNDDSPSSTSAPVSRPSLTRPRSSFNLRARGRSTTQSPENESHDEETASSSEPASTTTRSRRIQASGVRPLRPGPRINLGRGRPGQTTTTTEAPAEDHATGEAEPSNSNPEASEEKDKETSAPVDNSPLGRLKNKHRVNVQARPKAAASTPVQVRRVNPLLARRRPGQTTEASSSEAPQEVSTEAAEPEEHEETEAPAEASSTTTEEPRGLNKLLAGRRRLANRPAAHH